MAKLKNSNQKKFELLHKYLLNHTVAENNICSVNTKYRY